MKDMAAIIVSIDIGTTVDGGVGGLELRNDKIEEIVSDHKVEHKALEDSVLTLGDIVMDANHFRWIGAILKVVDSICVVVVFHFPCLDYPCIYTGSSLRSDEYGKA
ncbi:hypothetical protein WN943_016487 [Citrus x changshan-huyou]